ncbi:MAG: thiol:disulfide interchange protein [Caulobacteraceae bacterium]|nr:thiol:disulfide interchange protein [Caulobacteraceae bacterium]
MAVVGFAGRGASAQIAAPALPPAPPGAVNTGHLQAQLVPQTTGVAPGGMAYIAIRQSIAKGWHTYWRNPGDSGEATSAKWALPQGWSVGDTVWPAPQRLPLGPLMNYGYVGDVLLPVAVNVPASAKPGTTQTLNAAVTFLVCADICVPEDAKLSIALPVVGGTPGPDPKWGAAITRTLADAPKASGLQAVTAWTGQGADRALKLAVTGDPLQGADLSHAYFFPYDPKALDHAAHQNVERGPRGLTIALKSMAADARAAPSLAGVLSLGGQAWEVSAAPGALPAAAGGLGEVVTAKPDSTLEGAATAAVPAPGAGVGLPLAVAFAVLGGLILNLMPCVFPVLSMKAASLAAHAHAPGQARSQGLAFLAGVLATFLGLAAVLLAAKAGGAAIGWGFQLQSPTVVGALALIMLLVALNLSGVFEATLPGQGAGGSLAAQGGLVGAFFTGALAVVEAPPCTAPFMATALGFALTQSAPAALLVFLGLGLGFAAPFVAVAFIPGLLRRLPRPGAWMDTLRHVLAFPMYGTAAWLLWVFTLQAGSAALAALLAAAVLAGLFAWLVGTMQRSGRPVVPGVAAAIAAVLAVACLVVGARQTAPAQAQTVSAAPGGAEAASQPYTPAKLAELRAQGRPVFVNFTAAWCVTCQVNERLALGAGSVAKAIGDTGTVYLKADWTNHDSAIAKMLAEHGRAGVPLYLVYGAGGGDPVVLPQLLTPGAVVAALQAAAKPRA